ncbi:hypothetical protein AZ602_04145 [Moraxella sp. RCAD0137]|nr:hypothetical protein AZ602_04145 [Moraxella sp. RCAD0137]
MVWEIGCVVVQPMLSNDRVADKATAKILFITILAEKMLVKCILADNFILYHISANLKQYDSFFKIAIRTNN